jgi:hypothetical protein
VVSGHVEGDVAPVGVDHEHAALGDPVPDAELVEDVGVEDRDVRDDDVGRDELEEHVGADVARPGLLVAAEGLASAHAQRGRDQALIEPVEIDKPRLFDRVVGRHGLDAVRHRDERAWLHLRLLLTADLVRRDVPGPAGGAQDRRRVPRTIGAAPSVPRRKQAPMGTYEDVLAKLQGGDSEPSLQAVTDALLLLAQRVAQLEEQIENVRGQIGHGSALPAHE